MTAPAATMLPSRPSPASVDVGHLIATARIGRLQLRVIALCGLVVLLDGLDAQIVSYLGPALAREWGLSRTFLGEVFSAGLLGMLLGLLVMGSLADRFGRRQVIALSAVLLGISTALAAAAGSPTELLGYRVAAGIGLAGTLPNALALTGDYSPERWRASLLILMFTGFSFGSILGGGLVAALVAFAGWRFVFAAAGGLTLLLAPILAWTLPEAPHRLLRTQRQDPVAFLQRVNPRIPIPPDARLVLPQAEKAEVASPLELFRMGRGMPTALLWAACFASLMEIYLLQNWLPTVLADAGFPMGDAVLGTTAFFAGGIVGGLMLGPLMDRLGSARVLAFTFACAAVSVPMIGYALGSLSAAALAVALAGICVGGGQKGLNAIAATLYPAPVRSTGVAWSLGVGRIGSILGPFVVGVLMSRGWPAAKVFLLASLPMLAAAGAMLALSACERRQAPAPRQPSAQGGRP